MPSVSGCSRLQGEGSAKDAQPFQFTSGSINAFHQTSSRTALTSMWQYQVPVGRSQGEGGSRWRTPRWPPRRGAIGREATIRTQVAKATQCSRGSSGEEPGRGWINSIVTLSSTPCIDAKAESARVCGTRRLESDTQ